MSLKQDNATQWTLTYPAGDYNSSMEVVVTSGGIEIDGDLLTWAEIDAARSEINLRSERERMILQSSLLRLSHVLGYPALRASEKSTMDSSLVDLACERIKRGS
jgi:hypothetical protein